MEIKRKICVVGLGYVGLPVAVAFGKQHQVVAFDINKKRIDALKNGHDDTLEVSDEDLLQANLSFTSDAKDLRSCDFFIVAVPTPVDDSNQPDLSPLISASKTIGQNLSSKSIVVYESTVYPGATEEDCVPVLEKESGLKSGQDFHVGYSPERINPGDKQHVFTSILKIVSGQTPEVLDIIADVYASVVTAGVHKASSIKAAEAAKVIENSQRDLNIAFVNELSKIFSLMDIDTHEVLNAAATKWNFHKYNPGLVGGHCIGVDPYYLTYKAQKLGYHPEVLLAGRRINDSMPQYIGSQIIKKMAQNDKRIARSRIAILGVTFKENCPDTRNSKVFDLIRELEEYTATVDVYDHYADKSEVQAHYNIQLKDGGNLKNMKYDVLVVAVAHQEYRNGELPEYDLLFDLKGIYPKEKSIFRL
ncbi:nucleotide sugar dehydrogenase [Francisellaceae bacterium]|nr:nucleotide sugar dehydrogenase [Francisellaceae bacterium]